MRNSHWILTAGLILAAAAGAAHIRILSGGVPVFWADPADVTVVINSTGSDDLPDGGHVPAIRNAIDAWNELDGTSVVITEDLDPLAQASTDVNDPDTHLILFDEDNSTGWFTDPSLVSITPLQVEASGEILDADVIFNGADHTFTTSGEPGAYDLQSQATHELGHLLGFDNSGWLGSTMQPFHKPGDLARRGLSLDELRAVRDVYPDQVFPAQLFASITGTVVRSANGAPISGAHVAAFDTTTGRTTAATLTAADGSFTLAGLDAGTYTLHADPLNAPVGPSDVSVGGIETDFGSLVGPSIVVGGGQSVGYGALEVPPAHGMMVSAVKPSAVLLEPGVPRPVRLSGTGLGGVISVTASDPSLTVSVGAVSPKFVRLTVTAPAGALPGHADLFVSNGDDLDVLTGLLEVVPPAPALHEVSPTAGPPAGGTAITLFGSDFRPGLRVVIGSTVYRDGAPGGCTVVSDSAIDLVTAPSPEGSLDVVVIDPSGLEARLPEAYLFADPPVLSSVFPAAGAAVGGTVVTLVGDRFTQGATVEIDGVTQDALTFVSETTLSVTTGAGVVGGPYTLEVINPSGQSSSQSFTYVAPADPTLDSVSPSEAKAGAKVTLTGSGYDADTRVVFGVDPLTGLGGSVADVVLVDPNRLEVLVPQHAAGVVAVMVESIASGQAAVLPTAFTVVASGGGAGGGGGGGGGGGCHAAPGGSGLDGLWPLVLLVVLVQRRSRRSRVAALG